MKELSLKELQQVSSSVLKDVHDFCVANEIHYSLAYGTLIGAKRHKGFIPWDDDIDIIMTRPEYDLFCSTYHSSNNILITPNDSLLCFSRVCDNTLTVSKTTSPWTTKKVGVWIDVFPIDAVEDEKKLFSEKIIRLKALLDNQVEGRWALGRFSFSMSLRNNIRLLINKLKYSRINVKEVNQEVFRIVSEIPFGKTRHCSQLVCRGNEDKEFFDIDMFEDYEEVDFEQYKFMIASGWERILTMNYGDYMQLPPPEQRVPHGGFAKFYWR